MSAHKILDWFPDTAYYREHAERLDFSLGNLPDIPKGFACLSIGSWGTDAPYLIGALGASKVVCIRAPEPGCPAHEVRKIRAPNGLEVETEIHALNIEVDEMPTELLDRFDLVIAWEVLEHLCVDPARLVFQAVHALRMNGIISITTPNALWHCYTTAHLSGVNALGLKLQHHLPFATHWRLYSPAEINDLLSGTGCEPRLITSFLRTAPFSAKSWLFLQLLRFLRRNSGNGKCSYGQHAYVLGRKVREASLHRPEWLYPPTGSTGGRPVVASR